MKTGLFNYNGDIFWDEEEIESRDYIISGIKNALEKSLRDQNNAFRFFRTETPILTPLSRINEGYRDEVFITEEYALRPETTKGSYEYMRSILQNNKQKLPLCVWQVGKSFRREQDAVVKRMKLKEFHQLEFQIAYSENTKCDYSVKATEAVKSFLEVLLPEITIEPSDRLPDYSKETNDLICNGMEIASISKRDDFDHPVLEYAFGLDRIVYQYLC